MRGIDIVYSDNPYWERKWLTCLGKFDLQIRGVHELLPDKAKPMWKELLEQQFIENNLIHHRADHDVLALSMAVYELQKYDVVEFI